MVDRQNLPRHNCPMLKILTKLKKSIYGSGILSALAAFLIVFLLSYLGLLTPLENALGDKLRVRNARPLSTPIEIVYLDDASLKVAEQEWGVVFPWERATYSQIISVLKKSGAKAVVFDFLFTSASPWGIDDDRAFASTARKMPVFTGMMINVEPQPEAVGLFKKQTPLYFLPLRPGPLIKAGQGVEAPKPPLWGAFTGVGDVGFNQDEDSKCRSMFLMKSLDRRVYPSMALTTAWQLSGKPKLAVREHSLELGNRSLYLDDQGAFPLLFRDLKSLPPYVRLIELLAANTALEENKKPDIDLTRFKDKIVFIGSSAPALLDLRPSPFGKNTPGVQLQAITLDNLLSGENLKTPGLALYGWLGVFILCLLTAGFSFKFRGPLVLVLPLLFTALLAGLAQWQYASYHTLIPASTPALALLLAFVFSALENFLTEARARRRVQNVFGQFLSPAVLKSLAAHQDDLATGGETRTLSVFFSDLQGFTSFSEMLGPQQLVSILNEYLTDMAEVIVGTHEGYVDKYVGDAIMAFWNAPTDQPGHALTAVKAAWHCQLKLKEIQPRLYSRGLRAGDEGLVMRIGLHTGEAVVGLMGSRRKLNYTIMGDTVNLASRLESANKAYGSRVMLSESTLTAAGDTVSARELDLLRVKGKALPTRVYELIGLKGEPGELYSADHLAHWADALKKYRARDFKGALAVFTSLGNDTNDQASLLYMKRCAEYVQDPPVGDWDGVYVMKTK
jgi:adenylate cyclase